MIDKLNLGYLKYPSDDLVQLLSTLEHAILQTVGHEQLHYYTFQHIVQNVLAESTNFVGCQSHQKDITRTVINYYTLVRAKILCKTYNAVYDEGRKQEKEHRKLAKLVGNKDKTGTSGMASSGSNGESKSQKIPKNSRKRKIINTTSKETGESSTETKKRVR